MENGNLDAETRAALIEWKDEIITAVGVIIKDSTKELEKHLTEKNTIKFDNFEKTLSRHENYHENHFHEVKKINEDKIPLIDKKITDCRDEIYAELKDNKKWGIGQALSIVSLLIALAAVFLKFK